MQYRRQGSKKGDAWAGRKVAVTNDPFNVRMGESKAARWHEVMMQQLQQVDRLRAKKRLIVWLT